MLDFLQPALTTTVTTSSHVALYQRLKPLLLLAAVAGSAPGGSEANMPPEQLEPFRGCNAWGAPTAARHHQGLADVYSAGIALWSLVVGESPLQRSLVHLHRNHPQHQGNCADCSNAAHRFKLSLVSPSHSMPAQPTCTVCPCLICLIKLMTLHTHCCRL